MNASKGPTLGRAPTHCRTQTHTSGPFKIPNSPFPPIHVFALWGKLETLENTHATHGEQANSTHTRPGMGFKPPSWEMLNTKLVSVSLYGNVFKSMLNTPIVIPWIFNISHAMWSAGGNNGPFYVDSACVCMGFHWGLWFPPKDKYIRWAGDAKLPLGVSLLVSPLKWWLIQVVSLPFFLRPLGQAAEPNYYFWICTFALCIVLTGNAVT